MKVKRKVLNCKRIKWTRNKLRNASVQGNKSFTCCGVNVTGGVACSVNFFLYPVLLHLVRGRSLERMREMGRVLSRPWVDLPYFRSWARLWPLSRKRVKDILWRSFTVCRLRYIMQNYSSVCSTPWCVRLGNGVVNIPCHCGHVWDAVTCHAGQKLTSWGVQGNCGSNGKGQRVVEQIMSF